MQVEYIIVQAGGKGTRLEHLTKNKPKAIVPVYNLPMLFHLFQKFPDKKFIIIADYKKEVLRNYLSVFANIKYIITDAKEATGTCAGVMESLQKIPEQEPFMLIWSDLILPQQFELPSEEENYIGISKSFRCRWSYRNGKMVEEPSFEHGIAGLFIFKNKGILEGIGESGEFVRWLQTKGESYQELDLSGTKEFGVLEEYNKLQIERCRPFNRMTVEGDRIIKEGIDDQGRTLAVRERNWYRYVMDQGFPYIPKIYEFEPLIMEKINGCNVYEYEGSLEEKKVVLQNIVHCLKKLHRTKKCDSDWFSMKEAYISKTLERLNKVRNLIPFANDKYIVINGKTCRNVYFFQKEFEEQLERLRADEFCLIHGDCTFSNIMLRNDEEPVLIDPRGYFGYTENYGDIAYDWAKLYYSIKGNYDKFNIKEFRLDIKDDGIELEIASNGWEELEDFYLSLIGDEVDVPSIKLIHAVIWLSLTTYAWQDYDSICGAFYNGLYYLEEVQNELL